MPRKKTFSVDFALDRAMELFLERGYQETTMQVIAEHLKLSRRTIYYTFRGKSALFVQALRRYHGACRAPGLSELSNVPSPRAALVQVFEVAGGGGEERQRRARNLLIETVMGLKHRELEIARLVEEVVLDMEARFRDAIERGKAAAEIADRVDPVAVARVLLGLYLGWYVLICAGAAGEPVLSAVMQQVETLLPAPRRLSTPVAESAKE